MTSASPEIADTAAAKRTRKRLEISGTVQGVGFRPFLYRRAVDHGLSGFAANGPEGVVAEVEGPETAIDAFIADIRSRPPENAVIHDLSVMNTPPAGDSAFAIRESTRRGRPTAAVLPDLATCDACLAEIFDPGNRRYLYPFTNCTDCGPRYSIIHDLPYDRAHTAMQGFSLCSACAAEYSDPADRRFHAEPNACPDCGPRLKFWEMTGRQLATRHAALIDAAEAIRLGKTIAIKGLGGFHLVADARNEEAVTRLRNRKRRAEKPFAVMMPNLNAVKTACQVSPEEEALLTGRERPIVLLRRRPDTDIADAVAPDNNPYLGVMLPYTPLHHILMAELDFPVVATSGNVSDEPIAFDDIDAVDRLGPIADFFLVHDRPIVRPVDDSVARIIRARPQILRRARGYAPAPIAVEGISPDVLAMGGHLKAATAVTRDNAIVLSPHIGDLDTPLSRDTHAEVTDSLLRLYDAVPRLIACDRHPDYHSTRRAEEHAGETGRPLTHVQHHLAHVAAGMAEHGLKPPVLGVAWDGTGYGTDGTVWGGEFILVTADGWRRAGHLRPFPLPGGSTAIREPRRAALGLLYEMTGTAALDMDHLPPVESFTAHDRRTLAAMLVRGTNAPLTTSAGRLFDAVAALLNLHQKAAYEGQAACLLEWAVDPAEKTSGYEFTIVPGPQDAADWMIDWAPAIQAILADLDTDIPVAQISARFHAGLAAAIAEMAGKIGTRTVMLTGGCFQNAVLTEWAADALETAGIRPYWHETVPPGDGGLALGQAWWAARMTDKGEM